MKVDWHGPEATAAIRARLGANLPAAGEAILGRARELISLPGPPRSSPGSPPRVDSGRLLASLFQEADPASLATRFGSTEEHAVYTEVGTADMAARPWLTPAIVEGADDAARELAK